MDNTDAASDINPQVADLLQSIYYDESDPAGYASINKLYNQAKKKAPDELKSKINLPIVKLWLSGQQGYTLHKPARQHFKRNKIFAGGIDHQWQADLADMSDLAKYNEQY